MKLMFLLLIIIINTIIGEKRNLSILFENHNLRASVQSQWFWPELTRIRIGEKCL